MFCFRSLLEAIVRILGGAGLSVSLFAAQTAPGSPFPFLNHPLCAAAIVAVLLAVAAISPLCADRANGYLLRNAEENMFVNRCLSYFVNALLDRRRAADVRLYAVRQRVEDLYFGILLLEEQARQTRLVLALLQSNLTKLQAMLRHGTALQGDVDRVEAQYLSTAQQLTQAGHAQKSYRRMLELFTGQSLEGHELLKPEASLPRELNPARPELRHFEARLQANEAREAAVTAGTMPKIGLFAQAYYGYPGFNYFESMMKRDHSFNLLAGVKVAWDIDSFYRKKNDRRKLRLAAANISMERDIFLFDTKLVTRSQLDRIDGLKAVMREDRRIVELRTRVRKAAESQLDNGIIDTTELLTRLTDEKQARLTASYHEIQLLQSIYRLKYTLNR